MTNKQSKPKSVKSELGIKADNVVAIVPAHAEMVAALGGSNGGPTLEERITEWGRAAQSVQDDFHPLALDVLKRVFETRNATIALQLQNAMPKILRKREFAAWLATYSPIKLSQEHNETSNFLKCELREEGKDKLYRPFDIEKAEANPFFMKKEEVKALDPSKYDVVKDLVQKMTGLAKTILGTDEKAKPLADGISLGEAKGKLAELRKTHTILHNGKIAEALDGKTSKLVADALAKDAA